MKKRFQGLIILNWKTGKARLLTGKSKKGYLPFEVPIRYEFDLVIPDTKEHSVKGEIVIPEIKIQEMVANSI